MAYRSAHTVFVGSGIFNVREPFAETTTGIYILNLNSLETQQSGRELLYKQSVTRPSRMNAFTDTLDAGNSLQQPEDARRGAHIHSQHTSLLSDAYTRFPRI